MLFLFINNIKVVRNIIQTLCKSEIFHTAGRIWLNDFCALLPVNRQIWVFSYVAAAEKHVSCGQNLRLKLLHLCGHIQRPRWHLEEPPHITLLILKGIRQTDGPRSSHNSRQTAECPRRAAPRLPPTTSTTIKTQARRPWERERGPTSKTTRPDTRHRAAGCDESWQGHTDYHFQKPDSS